MALNQQDQEWVKLLTTNAVHQAVEAFAQQQLEMLKCLLKKHQEACPHGKKLERGKMLLLGVVLGIGLVAGGTGYGLARMIAGL
jgi:hypothetical protein